MAKDTKLYKMAKIKKQIRKLKGENKANHLIVKNKTLKLLQLLKIRYSLKTYDDVINLLIEKSRIKVE